MKKAKIIVSGILCGAMLFLSACGAGTPSTPSTKSTPEDTGSAVGSTAAPLVKVDKLSLAYSPSMDAQEILTTTEPLKELLKKELAKVGFEVGEVEISVATSFEAVGEAVSSGSVDIGIGGATIYVTYDDEVDLLLTSTRSAFVVNTTDPNDWNNAKAERDESKGTVGYYGLIYAGPSATGKALAAKVEAGEELTWEDLDKAIWAVGNTTSSAGYLYPALWLKTNYGKTISDLSNVVPGTNYPTMVTQAASEQIDIFVIYADGRESYEKGWNEEMGREGSIWDEVKVIGVTDFIANDVTMGSRTSETMQIEGFKEAFQQAMINIATTPEGKEAIKILSHTGYSIGKPSDYDSLREAQKLIKDVE